MAEKSAALKPIPNASPASGLSLDDFTLDFAPQTDAASTTTPVNAPVFQNSAGDLTGPIANNAYQDVTIYNGGVTFNLEFTLADSPTANFEADVENAAKLLSAAIHDKITVNLVIGYGEFEGNPLTNGAAEAGPLGGLYESYSSVRTALLDHAAAGDTNFSSLPTGSSIDDNSGTAHTNVFVWDAELKALGYISPTATADDGAAGFATNISDSLMVGVALHELTHAMGRVPLGPDPDIMEFFRYTASGVRLFDGNEDGAASYFSLDGGVTKLADYGENSDISDFLNNSLTTNDAFNEHYDDSTFQYLTPIDLTQVDVLGFNTVARKPAVYDFNADYDSDIVLRTSAGIVHIWESNSTGGYTAVGLGNYGSTWQIAGVGDFNADGEADFVLRDSSTGIVHILESNGSGGFTTIGLGSQGASWNVVGVGDFNGDHFADVLFQDSSGALRAEESNGSGGFTSVNLPSPGAGYQVIGTGDFNGDGKTDIFVRNSAGLVHVLVGNGAGGFTAIGLGNPGSNYQFVGVGDYNGDGKSDLAFQDTTTDKILLWESTGTGATSHVLGSPGAGYLVQAVGDYNGDGFSDLLVRNSSGLIHLLELNGTGGFTAVGLGNPGSTYSVQYPA